MTLDEAIKHAEEVMVENLEKTKGRNASDPIAINCFECAEEHRQLAKWLRDYKRLLESKTGHWIYKIYGGFHEQGDWYCSHCDYQFNYGNGHTKHCPECGYEMSEPSTEEKVRDKDYDWIIKR